MGSSQVFNSIKLSWKIVTTTSDYIPYMWSRNKSLIHHSATKIPGTYVTFHTLHLSELLKRERLCNPFFLSVLHPMCLSGHEIQAKSSANMPWNLWISGTHVLAPFFLRHLAFCSYSIKKKIKSHLTPGKMHLLLWVDKMRVARLGGRLLKTLHVSCHTGRCCHIIWTTASCLLKDRSANNKAQHL